MGAFFIFELGVCLWLTLVGVVSVSLLVELGPTSPAKPDFRQTLLAIVALGCVTAVISRATFDWGIVAIAMLATLGCGLSVAMVALGIKRLRNSNWPLPIVSVMSGLVAFVAAVVACCVVLPLVNTIDYSERVVETVTRDLTPLYDSNSPLVECEGEADRYYFKYARQVGDPTGVCRGILDSDHVTFLDEDNSDPPYVECEVVVMAKNDPISGRLLNISRDRHFRPIMLYTHQSDIVTIR